ncbi:MAG: hypothetical protein KBS54_03505 [Synergistaceae bacterium]|nr:hypothetical protein [Candidatus Equadaptatus faecalis]
MNALEKVAYLRGLVDGQKIADTEEKKRFVNALIDTLECLATEQSDHVDMHAQLNEYLEQLENDVTDLEDDVDGLLGYDDEEEHHCCCGHGEDGEFEDFDEEEYAAVTCPFCGKEFYYEPDSYDEDENLLCPHCGKPFKQPEIPAEE